MSPLEDYFSEKGQSEICASKKPAFAGFLLAQRGQSELLQLGFLVHHMLAYLGIVFLHFDLFWCGALVLGRGVEMTGTGTGFEFDFFAHFRVP
jgi:hypothetical protein